MRLADDGWVFDPVCTSGVFFFFFFARKLTAVKHARIRCGVPHRALGAFV